MFDGLREDANANNPFDEVPSFVEPEPFESTAPPKAGRGRFLGMTAPQRLLIAILLMLAVCVLGSMCLLITGRIGFF